MFVNNPVKDSRSRPTAQFLKGCLFLKILHETRDMNFTEQDMNFATMTRQHVQTQAGAENGWMDIGCYHLQPDNPSLAEVLLVKAHPQFLNDVSSYYLSWFEIVRIWFFNLLIGIMLFFLVDQMHF